MKNVLQYFLGISTIVVGIDKFLLFLPVCSLTKTGTETQFLVIGVIEIILGLLLLFDKKTVVVLYVTIALMVSAIAAHLQAGTTDVLLAVLGLIFSVVLLVVIKKGEPVKVK